MALIPTAFCTALTADPFDPLRSGWPEYVVSDLRSAEEPEGAFDRAVSLTLDRIRRLVVVGPVHVGRPGNARSHGPRPHRTRTMCAPSLPPGERDVHVVAVAGGVPAALRMVGATAVGAPAAIGGVGAPDLVVPDDVHHAEPPGVCVLVALIIGRQHPGDHGLRLGRLRGVADRVHPVHRATVVVLTVGDRAAGADAAEGCPRVGRGQQLAELGGSHPRRRTAGVGRHVRRELLDPRRQSGGDRWRRGCGRRQLARPDQAAEQGNDRGKRQTRSQESSERGSWGHGVLPGNLGRNAPSTATLSPEPDPILRLSAGADTGTSVPELTGSSGQDSSARTTSTPAARS